MIKSTGKIRGGKREELWKDRKGEETPEKWVKQRGFVRGKRGKCA